MRWKFWCGNECEIQDNYHTCVLVSWHKGNHQSKDNVFDGHYEWERLSKVDEVMAKLDNKSPIIKRWSISSTGNRYPTQRSNYTGGTRI